MENKQMALDWTSVSEVELIYKSKIKASNRPVIRKSVDAYELLKQLWNDGTIDLQEEFKVLFLNRANRVLGVYNMSKGGMTGTVADVRLLFSAALKASAVALCISHNHPSGNLNPSKTDEELTAKIAQAAKLLDMKLLDHIIISAEGYLSFADEGLL
jgi:DNA repair protein RadC